MDINVLQQLNIYNNNKIKYYRVKHNTLKSSPNIVQVSHYEQETVNDVLLCNSVQDVKLPEFEISGETY